MDPGEQTFSLDIFNSWKMEALKEFLSKRGLSTDGTKAELTALCFASNTMKIPLKVSDSNYVAQLQKEYKDLLFIDGKILPYPLQIGGGWQDERSGLAHWPPLFLSDIVKFLIDRGNSNTLRSYMNDYKVGKSYEYLESKLIKEMFYHPISPSSSVCYLRAKCTPSQRLKDENHTLWTAVCKETVTVKSAFCSCTARMGQTCNHVAALLFRVESANKLGLTSCTSLSCNWKVPTATQVVPIGIKELNVRKSRHGQVKSRSLVSSQKMRYRPEESMTINTVAFTDDMRKALTNACLFKGIDLPEKFIAPKLLERQDNTDNDNRSALSTPIPNENEPMEVVGSGHVYFCTIYKCQVLEQENIKSFGQRSICCDLCEQFSIYQKHV